MKVAWVLIPWVSRFAGILLHVQSKVLEERAGPADCAPRRRETSSVVRQNYVKNVQNILSAYEFEFNLPS